MPNFIGRVLMKAEVRFAFFLYRLGGGIDEAILTHIENDEESYKPALWGEIFRKNGLEKFKIESLNHMYPFMKNPDVRSALKEYADSISRSNLKSEILKILETSKRW